MDKLPDIRQEFLQLQQDVFKFTKEVHRLRPTFRLLLNRNPLKELEKQNYKHLEDFVRIESRLMEIDLGTGGDFNSTVRSAAVVQMHAGVRDSVRDSVSNASAMLGSLRNGLDFKASLFLTIIAVGLAVFAIVVEVWSELRA